MKLYAILISLLFRLSGRDVRIGTGASIHPLAVISPGGGSIFIGAGAHIHRGAMLMAYGGKIRLGDNVSVNPYTILYGHGGLEIGSGVRIAAQVIVIPADHEYADRNRPISHQGERRRGIVIEDDVWIGAGARVLDGAYISKGCVIGANAVIKGKTEPFGVYAGVPAKLIKQR